MITDNFTERHIGPWKNETSKMLDVVGVKSLDELIDQTVPLSIRRKSPLNIASGINEYEYLNHLKEVGSKNKIYRSFIGMGYYNSITPPVITRNILENPGWYTAYTPYQAEISQGRLEALLNFQTMISDLTALPIANASLLDEATSAAEAMIMLYNARSRDAVKKGANVFFVDTQIFPQTIDVLKTRSAPLGIELVFGDYNTFQFSEKVFGAIVQYPNLNGKVNDYSSFISKAHTAGAKVAVAADLMSLALLTPPGELGADVVLGSTQRFGLPLGYGGPHAGFFAVKEEYKRSIPGRIIGISVDAAGNRALRMALQTREQHIKREKATSNICTSQVLLAIMSSMYAVYHGYEGIKNIADDIHKSACLISEEIQKLGYKQLNNEFFDTLIFEIPSTVKVDAIKKIAVDKQVNFNYISDKLIGLSADETVSLNDINTIIGIFAKANNKSFKEVNAAANVACKLPAQLKRKSSYLQNPVFNSYHSETEMMRYIKKLEEKDLSLNRSMIPLGSCTMKLNAASELFALSWPEFGNIHPFVPSEQAEGYQILMNELEKVLCETTGFAAISFQPNSGAAGEYTGLMVIRAYHQSRGDAKRTTILIPASAHGTNPASAVMAGMQVVVVKCDDKGNIDTNDLREKATQYKDTLAALMVTYPSTHGVFEENILEICKSIHDCGGQVYMDGANMNAQVGLTNPATIGADVCHLNLHKTFAIPHGGGGPGVGPIGVAKHLVQFLPTHSIVKTGGEKGITAVSASPFGSAMVLPISYGYIKMMGGNGLTLATKMAILNANYIKTRLEKHYPILYSGSKGRVAHEMILDCNNFKKTADIEAIEIAKRLMDYGFHAPTVAFPVHGTLMVEPTESEPLHELDRFCEAMIMIREEIREIEEGKADKVNNVIKKAPHTLKAVTAAEWNAPYSREKAAFPVKSIIEDKYWPTVSKIDDAYGDRNLVCSCESN
ncbi:MAG TPA: aminomethyl-transferring glycine dehydrogenase [Bacteroidales bacterium]|nr:aminomethyl-transferring glycine dehydrogenase [Bacteroidales bacterium]HPS17121.1 aminomethyl-transferring glycine dehydrogenase [Bacteroidales bacterium]